MFTAVVKWAAEKAPAQRSAVLFFQTATSVLEHGRGTSELRKNRPAGQVEIDAAGGGTRHSNANWACAPPSYLWSRLSFFPSDLDVRRLLFRTSPLSYCPRLPHGGTIVPELPMNRKKSETLAPPPSLPTRAQYNIKV
jgi:hypothetical protein